VIQLATYPPNLHKLVPCWARERGACTSAVIVRNSSHINRGNMFFRKGRFRSVSTISSSASRGWSGKDAGEVLHAFMAQVRKLRVRSFIFFWRAVEGFEVRTRRAEDWGPMFRGNREQREILSQVVRGACGRKTFEFEVGCWMAGHQNFGGGVTLDGASMRLKFKLILSR
jgi:hypothetical protein